MTRKPQLLDKLRTLSKLFRRPPVPACPILAVFIDADGISPHDAEKVLEHLVGEGRITVLRSFGNFAGRAAEGWAKVSRKRGLIARHLGSLVPGKNAADIALAIDAIEVLLTCEIDIFVIVASDVDFTPLAIRLREGGKSLLVYGHRSTPLALQHAATVFHIIGRLALPPGTSVPPPAAFWSRQPSDAGDIVLRALAELGEPGEQISLSDLRVRIAELQPGFDPRTFSRRSLSLLVKALPFLTLVNQNRKPFVVQNVQSGFEQADIPFRDPP